MTEVVEKFSANYPNTSWWSIDLLTRPGTKVLATSESETSPRHPTLNDLYFKNDIVDYFTMPNEMMEAIHTQESIERKKSYGQDVKLPDIDFGDETLSLTAKLKLMVNNGGRIRQGSKEGIRFPNNLHVGLFATQSANNYEETGAHNVICSALIPNCKTRLMWIHPVDNAAARTALYQDIEDHFGKNADYIANLMREIETPSAQDAAPALEKLKSVMQGYAVPEAKIEATATPFFKPIKNEDGEVIGTDRTISDLLYLGLPTADGGFDTHQGTLPTLPHKIGSQDWKNWMRANGRRFPNAGSDDHSAIATVILGNKDFPGTGHVALTMICDYDAHPNGAPLIFATKLPGDPHRNTVAAQDVIARENFLTDHLNDLSSIMSDLMKNGVTEPTMAKLASIATQKTSVDDKVLTQLVQSRKGLAARIFDYFSHKTDVAVAEESQVERLTRQLEDLLNPKVSEPITSNQLVHKLREEFRTKTQNLKNKVLGKSEAIETERIDAEALTKKMAMMEATLSSPIADLVRVAHGQKAKPTEHGRTKSEEALGFRFSLSREAKSWLPSLRRS